MTKPQFLAFFSIAFFQMTTVKLVSSDGKEFEVPKKVAEMSGTVKNMLDNVSESGHGNEDVALLPNVSGETLGKVVAFCKHHHHVDTPAPDVEPAAAEDGTEEPSETGAVCEWDAEFCKMPNKQLFELILAADYLDIRPLLQVTCKTVARLIKGKSPEEMRNCLSFEEEDQGEKKDKGLESGNDRKRKLRSSKDALS